MENLKVNQFKCLFDKNSMKRLRVESPSDSNYEIVDKDKNILRFKLKKEDEIKNLGNRVELYYFNDDPVYSEAYYLLKIKIDKNMDLDNHVGWSILTQFHDKPGKGETWATHKPSPPPIALALMKNKLRVNVFNRIEWKIFNIAQCDIEVDKWYEVLWHVKWSMGEDGFVEVFINGENITKGKYYTPTLFHFTGNTVKFGIYNNESDFEMITYCNKFIIGNTLKEVESEYVTK